MRFTTREEIEAPIDHVFGRLSDFAHLERMIMRRGVEVSRDNPGAPVEVGTRWTIGFKFRGKPRSAEIVLAKIQPPIGHLITFESGGIGGESQIELTPLSPTRTRLMVRLELTPQTLAARLLLQSIKLAKTNLNQRFKTRIADLAEDIETDYSS